MSRESKEFAQGLRQGHDNQGPQINWTRGFNGEDEDDNTSSSNHSQPQTSGGNDRPSPLSNARWDEDADDSGWW